MADEPFEKRIERLEERLALISSYMTSAIWKALDQAYEPSLNQRDIRCIVCGHTGKRDQYVLKIDKCMFGGGRLERYECPNCDCIFGPLKYLDLDEGFVALDYKLLYTVYSEASSTETERRTFHSLSPIRGATYLNWGCGAWSRTIDVLRHDGWDVWGFEPSASVSGQHIAKSRAELSTLFDGIFSNNVIEHFRDPVAQFREFHSRLKQGGKMAHSSPCYEYAYSFSRFHTVFLLGRSPYLLAEKTGFEVIDKVRDGEYVNFVFERRCSGQSQ